MSQERKKYIQPELIDTPDDDLSSEMMGLLVVNPLLPCISSARAAMFDAHITQRIVINNPSVPTISSGLTDKLSRYNYSIKSPVTGKIIHKTNSPCVDKCRLVVVDEKEESLHVINIIPYLSINQKYGFMYKFRSNNSSLNVGNRVIKDKVIADSPASPSDSEYRLGKTLNVIHMDIAETDEDACVISESASKALEYTTIETVTINLSAYDMPLNIFGDENNYLSLPVIGSKLEKGGIIMSVRRNNAGGTGEDLKIADNREIHNENYILSCSKSRLAKRTLMDITYRLDGPYPAEVIDIKVLSNVTKPTNYRHLVQLENIVKEAKKEDIGFIRTIDKYEQSMRSRGITPKYSDELSQEIVTARATTGEIKGASGVKLTTKGGIMSPYQIEVTVARKTPAYYGNKIVDYFGNKCVISGVWKDDDMPGGADIIRSSKAIDNRMTPGAYHSHVYGASSVVAMNKIKEITGNIRVGVKTARTIKAMPIEKIDAIKDILVRYYQIVSPPMYTALVDATHADVIEHITSIMINGKITIYLFVESLSKIGPKVISEKLYHSEFKAPKVPVTYRSNSGKKVTTKTSFIVGPMDFLLLNKSAEGISASNSVSPNTSGISAVSPRSVKSRTSISENSVTLAGGDELTLIASVLNPIDMADLSESCNSPVVHRHICKRILDENIGLEDDSIDRRSMPYGTSAVLASIEHVLACQGVMFKYKDDNPKY